VVRLRDIRTNVLQNNIKIKMQIRKYNKITDESKLMKMIGDEEGWDYANETLAVKYKVALETSITYVAYQEDILCGYSRSLNDFGEYIYVCDLLVMPLYRGKEIGKKLMECIYKDYPNQVVFVMSDVDGYYEKVNYKRIGSIFEVPRP
jgi:ribosomal protein S18 acetylase RimI-like enzyme